MLFADKRNLETNLQVSLLKIRDKELQFYVGNCIASAPARAPTPPNAPCVPLTAVFARQQWVRSQLCLRGSPTTALSRSTSPMARTTCWRGAGS
jgi:hypothetical protein